MEWLCAVFALERWSQLRRWRCGGCCCWWCCECVYTHTHFSEYLPLNAPTLRLSSLFSLNNCALVHNSLSLSGAGRRDNIVVSVRAGGKECKVDSFKPGAESGVHRVILVISRNAKAETQTCTQHTHEQGRHDTNCRFEDGGERFRSARRTTKTTLHGGRG